MPVKVKVPTIVWKKSYMTNQRRYCLVKLSLPVGALMNLNSGEYVVNLRSGYMDPLNKKCRASEAKVLGFFSVETLRRLSDKTKVISEHDPNFKYIVGKKVKPIGTQFSKTKKICAAGIHFFIEKTDAITYGFN